MLQFGREENQAFPPFSISLPLGKKIKPSIPLPFSFPFPFPSSPLDFLPHQLDIIPPPPRGGGGCSQLYTPLYQTKGEQDRAWGGDLSWRMPKLTSDKNADGGVHPEKGLGYDARLFVPGDNMIPVCVNGHFIIIIVILIILQQVLVKDLRLIPSKNRHTYNIQSMYIHKWTNKHSWLFILFIQFCKLSFLKMHYWLIRFYYYRR